MSHLETIALTIVAELWEENHRQIDSGVAKVYILGGGRDLVLPTYLVMVTDMGEGSNIFMIFE